MDHDKLKALLTNVQNGKISVTSAVTQLKKLPFEDIGFAKVDHHRNIRNGYPEVIFCPGKSTAQIIDIIQRLLTTSNNIMASRADYATFCAVKKIIKEAKYYEQARIISINQSKRKKTKKMIYVLTAGTSDIPVAEEAAVSAELMGNAVERIYDVGVAGIHRLFANGKSIEKANVLIVVAGMEGALVSVVGGLVDKPVIAVPTSVGYGASFGGLSALLTMLNCCASGVGVVNIDNGFGAGYLASVINKL